MNNRGGPRGGGRVYNPRNQRGRGRGSGSRGSPRPTIVAGDAATQPKLRLYPPGSAVYSNWFQVKEHWKAHIQVKFGFIATRIIPFGEYPVRQLPDWDDILQRFGPEAGGTEEAATRVFNTQCDKLAKDSLKDEEVKQSIFACFHSQCTDEVKEKLEADDEWDNVFGNQDPVQWYQLADRVMSTPLAGDLSGNIRLAEKAFAEYRQGDKQSLIEYKRGFDLRWRQCVAIGAPERDAEYLCSAFIRGLHPLFSSLIEAYDNNLMGDRPTDVSTAYQAATRWKTVKLTKSTHTAGDATVFVTSLASTKHGHGGGRGQRGGRGGGRGGQRGRGPRSHEEEKKEDDGPVSDITEDAWRTLTRPPRGSCFKCWRRGHFVGECPNDFHPNYNHRQGDDVVAFPMLSLSAGSGIFDLYELGLDTLSDINVIKDLELGWNYRKARVPINVVGINGAHDPTSLDVMCDTVFGPAYLGPVNVVSAGAAWENGWSRIRDDWHDEEVMQKGGIKLYFTRRRGRNVYTADGSQLTCDQAGTAEAVQDTESYRSLGLSTRSAFPTFETVQDVERIFNNRELARAREARTLFKMLGYPSPLI